MDTPTLRISPIVIIAVFCEMIFLILAGVAIHDILAVQPDPLGVKIDDYTSLANTARLEGSIANFDDNRRSIIEDALYYTVARNNPGTSVATFGATIRDNSLVNTYIDDLDTPYLNFLVDIPSLQQSYRVIYYHSTFSTAVITSDSIAEVAVLCPKDNELIYGDFDCQDDYRHNGEDNILAQFIGSKLFSNFSVAVVGDAAAGEHISFDIRVESDEPEVTASAVTELSNFLRQLGFSLDDYEYTVGTYTCCEL